MPLNKLDNFIKNTEGRILYVSPDDLDSTDSISNEGNSLARPFKTLQRALIESARFSYIKGRSNDLVEKTTILLMPGEHVIDNRPGLAIYNSGGTAKVRRPNVDGSGSDTSAITTLNLDLDSKFDLTQEDNILYKFNSIYGGVVVPRGTSVVGLDLRKTKLRPTYVPNPTYNSGNDVADINPSAIFRVTGGCYFWQFSIFDGNDLDEVYTDPDNFSKEKKATPTFSHHKLTVFEYADGVNKAVYKNQRYDLTDLDMYYAKVGNAYNEGASTREIKPSEKWPANPLAFEKTRPEYEIVGAFASDPLKITNIQAGKDTGGVTPIVTVTTEKAHGFQVGTPVKIRGINPTAFNASAVVLTVSNTNDKEFTYSLPSASVALLGDGIGTADNGNVTVETDTVRGASPYIFNCSLRSVYGMNGMKADGNNATGFKSMVVAQFTGVSLQKDDRAFVKYDSDSRSYNGNSIERADGGALASGSSNTATGKAYHLDSQAIYRQGWESTHITITNDAILQIVSVFAIGYARHFFGDTGADASITNSNSNFGQLSLVADGFKKEAFEKDNKAFITSIIPPRAVETDEDELQWVGIDTTTTVHTVGDTSKLYFATYKSKDNKPPISIQGFKPGAKTGDLLSVEIDSGSGIVTYTSPIVMPTYNVANSKEYPVTTSPTGSTNEFVIGANNLETGEKVIVISDDGDLPENIETDTVYYIIKSTVDSTNNILLAASESDATTRKIITVSGGTNLKIVSRVTDKEVGEAKHPVQWDASNKQWYVNTVGASNNIYNQLKANFVDNTTNNTYIKRKADTRGLDEKVYKLRVVIPKELKNAKDPENGFVLQESSTTGFRDLSDFTLSRDLLVDDYEFKRNPGFISTCGGNGAVKTVRTELPHKLNVGDIVVIKKVKDTINTTGVGNSGYNGTYPVLSVPNDLEFTYQPSPDVSNSTSFTNNTSIRNTDLPTFERSDLQSNLYIYRSETISSYIEGVQDGVYHLYVLSADKKTPLEFTDYNYSQNVVDLYPQMDRDNVDANPRSTVSFAKRAPLGEVVTSDLKKSITREAVDEFSKVIGIGITIDSVTDSGTSAELTFAKPHGFAGILTGKVSQQGSSYTNGTFYNIKLLDNNTNPSSGGWKGATAKVFIDGTAIQTAEIQSHGSGYSPTELYFDDTFIAGNGGGRLQIEHTGISSAVGNAIQITGIGTTSSGFYQIASVPTDKSITITKTATDPVIIPNQYVLPIVPALSVSEVFNATTGITTFTSTKAHGLVKGNGFRVLNSSNTNVGDFIVSDVPTGTDGVTKFSAVTNAELSNVSVVLKHGYAANGEVSDRSNENLGARSVTVFENNHAYLSAAMTSDGTSMELDVVGIVTSRFQYGSYVEVGSEIMRIASPKATGSDNILKVIRGALATNSVAHANGSLVKAIKPLPIEFHRPSILRASGHTFEYLGYGPGNYSTALPQVQDRTLTDREEFLVQSQEKSGGIVVYTGMNNKGDFYIGNLKKSSATGEETTFDTPIPTVTGETPSRLSAIFDEVTVKERIVVEGGDGTDIPSKFDGPVTFNNNARFNGGVDLSSDLKINTSTPSSSTSTGALVVAGGVGVGLTLSANSLRLADGKKAFFGNDGDLEIVHDAGNSIVRETGTGELFLQSDGIVYISKANGNDIMAEFSGAGAAKLHWRGTSAGLRLETTQAGVTVQGEGRFVNGDVIAFASSDKRLKDNISPIKQALDKVKSLSGNTFDWNAASGKEGSEVGVIAQEVDALNLPGITTIRDDGTYAVRYEKLVPVLIEAIKELSAKVDALESMAHPKPTGKTQKRNEDRLDALENKINN